MQYWATFLGLPNSNACTDTYPYGYTDSNAYTYADSDTDPYANANTDSNCYTYADSIPYSTSYTDANASPSSGTKRSIGIGY